MATNPNAIALGPGNLFAAPLGTAEPTDASTALSGTWRDLGSTHEGSTFRYQLNAEDIDVAEEIDPVRVVTVGRQIGMDFVLAEKTYQNLAFTLNSGANVAVPGDKSYEPPDPGAEVRLMLVHQAVHQARWLLRQCLNTGNVEIANQKAPAKAGLPSSWRAEKPSGARPFKVWANSTTNFV